MFNLCKNQIWLFSKSTLLCVVASFLPYLSLNLCSSCIWSSSLFLLAISLLSLTTIFFITKKNTKNVSLPENPDQDNQNLTIPNKTQLEKKPEPILECELELETESSNVDSVSSQSFEIFNNNGAQDENLSDYSISDYEDEDSLIEIKLPFVEEKQNQDFSFFEQQGLMELLEEINGGINDNEEDNLIEIDISMGSIKASRFEIEA